MYWRHLLGPKIYGGFFYCVSKFRVFVKRDSIAQIGTYMQTHAIYG